MPPIDSQANEMLQLAEREGLDVVDIKRESHSAKETGQRPVFNEIVQEIKEGKFNGILTWAPDRISRNAGNLGKIVDLMDAKLLMEIRTYGQRFTNSPNEKFLLMILGSQVKLENDSKAQNVRRGLRARCEMGLWPCTAPTDAGMDKKGRNLPKIARESNLFAKKVVLLKKSLARTSFWPTARRGSPRRAERICGGNLLGPRSARPTKWSENLKKV